MNAFRTTSFIDPEWMTSLVQSQRTVLELYRMSKLDRLLLQRDEREPLRWQEVLKVRFIESLLCRLPIPPIYMADETDGRSTIIDGRERLAAVFTYIEGCFPLVGLAVFTDFERYRFVELPVRLRRRIEDTPMNLVSLLPGVDPSVRELLQARLNPARVEA